MTTHPIVSVGIDWADAQHDFHLIAPDCEHHSGSFKQDPTEIEKQIEAWRKLCPGAVFAIAIEATKGAIVNALLEFSDVQIYPVNPAALASYRKAFAHGGGKNDPSDARLLAQFIDHYRQQLRPLRRNDELTRQIATLAEDRRRLVDQRADLTNRLTALLKCYFPAALALKPARSYSEFFLKFLAKYQTLQQTQRAGETRLRSFFHGIGIKRKADGYVKLLIESTPLTNDPATIATASMHAAAIVEQLQILTKHIKRYDGRLKELVPQHDLFEMADSLPGISTNTQARLIAALGDDRQRFPNAKSLQAASGIAPVTKQSGKQKHVYARWACTKFMKQTFHELAGLSITQSRWAKAFYEYKKSKHAKEKHAAQIAKRALAYKWQRIIFRLWQTGERYDEERYIARLKATGSPLYELIKSS
ncbi:IS110 family transposase [Novipirellula sp.]|uniref:IS110 family transposase n=1 Tax=Novipirellula sp. TaxID=2795430 RepID=UPI00356AF815